MNQCLLCRGHKLIASMGGMVKKCTQCDGVGYIDKVPELPPQIVTLELRKDKAFKDLKSKAKQYKQSAYKPLEDGESEVEVESEG